MIHESALLTRISAILVYLIYVTHTSSCSQLISNNSAELKYWEDTTNELPIFDSLDSVLKFLQQPQYVNLQPAQKILYAFDSVCMNGNPFFATTRRRVFIAIEGNHRTTMDILSKRLSKRIGASYLRNPPNCLAPYRSLLLNGTPLCKAYYDLGLYSIAHRVRLLWNQWNVVTKGYWIDQLIYTLSRLDEFPPEGSPVYDWPRDLLVPDLILFIDVPTDVVFHNMSTRPPQSWKNRCHEIYKKIKFVKIHVVNTVNGMENTMNDIEQIIMRQLSQKFHIQFYDDAYRLNREPHLR